MTGSARPRTLLVVEDDADNSNLLRMYFAGHGYTVEVTKSGADGLAQAHKHAPDLILLDINLPDVNGFAVCKDLRQSLRTSHIPIIFLTERASQSDRVAGLSAGAKLNLLDEQEKMFVICHELGHIKCEHVLYTLVAENLAVLIEIFGKMARAQLDCALGAREHARPAHRPPHRAIH